jgi:hypothetical protein
MHDLMPVLGGAYNHEIDRMLKNLALHCPTCGAGRTRLAVMNTSENPPHYLIHCKGCGHRGAFGKSIHAAIKKWNRPVSLLAALIEKWARIIYQWKGVSP